MYSQYGQFWNSCINDKTMTCIACDIIGSLESRGKTTCCKVNFCFYFETFCHAVFINNISIMFRYRKYTTKLSYTRSYIILYVGLGWSEFINFTQPEIYQSDDVHNDRHYVIQHKCFYVNKGLQKCGIMIIW